MSKQFYSIPEAAHILGVKERAVQRRAKRYGIKKRGGRYLIPHDILTVWKGEEANTEREQDAHDTHTVYGVGMHHQEDGTVMQVFTQDEYDTFKRMLIEHKELKSRVAQLQDWVERFTTYTQERNTIEAHEKGLLKHVNENTEDVEPIERMVIEKRSQKISDKESQSLSPSDRMDFNRWMKYLSGDA